MYENGLDFLITVLNLKYVAISFGQLAYQTIKYFSKFNSMKSLIFARKSFI